MSGYFKQCTLNIANTMYDTTASSTALHEYVKTGVCLCVLLAV